ncbi:MAG: amidohydrolase [Mycobacterium sp.]|nr:amidohydrolase [Mycobacterium sp.]
MNTIFTARKVITMNPANPEVQAVAVRDGRIICAGTLEECHSWGEAVVDDRFADHVLIPGFVEAHGHTMDSASELAPYVGYFPYPLSDGTLTKPIRSYEDLIARLKEEDATLPAGEPLVANGFDPIYFPDLPRLSKRELDQVSATRPIFVRHASGHLATVNTALLEAEGITADSPTPGVGKGPDGQPDGELQEAPAMMLAKGAFEKMMASTSGAKPIQIHAAMCRNAGVTTSTELVGVLLIDATAVQVWQDTVNDAAFPVRMVLYNLPTMPGSAADYDAVAEAAVKLRDIESDKLRVPGIKLVADGSIQGWTAVMMEPGYYTGEDHGLLMFSPEDLLAAVKAFHARKLNVHCHCNGNAAGQIFVDAVEEVLRHDAWLDHRHVLQHSQTTTAAQYRKMGRLGICANIFTNHIWFWGDQHYEQTMGPERTRGMWACRTALDNRVPLSFHTDSGVTPIGHLMTMWCAVNRVTPSGRVLGDHEKLTPYEALHAATIGGAFQLHMDHEIGSIEAGKFADFAVLDQSPLDVDPMAIRDIAVWGTVLGGKVFEAAHG